MFTHQMANGLVFTVKEQKILGLVSFRLSEISIAPNQPPSERLETFIHEWFHAEFPAWSEEKVDAQGFRFAYWLWHCGCRKDLRLRSTRSEFEKFLEPYFRADRVAGFRKCPALARSLAGMLWKAGYRLPKRKK